MVPGVAPKHFGDLNFASHRPDGSHALHDANGEAIHDRFFGQSSFSTFAIAKQRNTVKVRRDLPLELLAPLGCRIQTGAGAVNTLDVKASSSFAAFGVGAVGRSAIMAARVAGATTIIAVDIVPSCLDLALEVGTTHIADGNRPDLLASIAEICSKGIDFALESTAHVEVMAVAVATLRARGVLGLVGAVKPRTSLPLDVGDMAVKQKVIRGIVEGDSVPDVLISQLVELYA